MYRTTLCLVLLLLALPTSALEVVLRDTIGPGSSATDGTPAIGAATNRTTFWDMPGLRFSNPFPRSVRLSKIRNVMSSFDLLSSTPINDAEVLAGQPIELHIWLDGVLGEGDTFEANPGGMNTGDHPFFPLNFSQMDLITITPLGVTGPEGLPPDQATFLVTANTLSLNIVLPPSREFVYSVVESVNGDSIVVDQHPSRISLPEEDLFHFQEQEQSPGFLVSQLGASFANYAGYVAAELLEADYNGDGVVGAADYTIWRNNLGVSGLAAWSPGDGDGDGDITVADYEVWRTQYGMTFAALGSASTASLPAPEPGAFSLLVFGVAGVFACRRELRR